jgi:anti-anti-sigma factor
MAARSRRCPPTAHASEGSLEVAVEGPADGVGLVRLRGRLDMLSAGEVQQQLAETVAAGRAKLVVDLTGVTFLDSSGLGALIGGLKAARLAGGDLRIAGAGQQALTVLALTSLDRVMRPYSTVEEAMTGL